MKLTVTRLLLALTAACVLSRGGLAQTGDALPTGVRITPTLPRGVIFQPLNPDLPTRPAYTADHAVSTALSPDGKTLLILTSGFNLNIDATSGRVVPAESNEYVFVYDVSVSPPVKKQVVQVPNTFCGLAWSPSGHEFYVPALVSVTASGVTFLADVLFVYGNPADTWMPVAQPIPLGHNPSPPFSLGGLGLANTPQPAGVAVSGDGKRLVVANYGNDSVSVIDVAQRKVIADVDLRPGKSDASKHGTPGGEYPFWVAIAGSRAYVSSVRDREIVVVDISGTPVVTGRVKVSGQPNKMVLNPAGTLLYAAMDNTDSVAVVDVSTNAVVEEIKVTAPPSVFANERDVRGANPNSVAVSPDGGTLYVTNGGTNSIAVVGLGTGSAKSAVRGLIPTGWYPSSVSVSADGSRLFVVNAKSVPGPNKGNCIGCDSANQYILQLEKAGFATLPVPTTSELAALTTQVADNNNFSVSPDHDRGRWTMAVLRQRIKHVVYIIKENRTYDQVLGDLAGANGDPTITMFPEANTPNLHSIAKTFVALDNFYDSGETSGYGWNWSTAGRTNDLTEKVQPVNYAGRGGTYDWEGSNRNINVGIPTLSARLAADPATPQDPDLLPGTADVAEHDAPGGGAGAGYIWDAAIRAGVTVRNYGFFLDLVRYSPQAQAAGIGIALNRQPFQSSLVVAFPTKGALKDVTDPYFRGFDQAFPDYWLFKEWEREFDQYVTNGNLPGLSLVRLAHDHFGSFSSAIDGLNTPQRQIADNDYAVGLLLQKIAGSPYKDSTLVFVIEDDAQDGPDHVDAHRSIAFVAGPFVRQGAVVSTRYSTVNMLRTIEEVLGLSPLGLYDATQEPMTDVFDVRLFPKKPVAWSYKAIYPAILGQTSIPQASAARLGPEDKSASRARDAEWWAEHTEDMDFEKEDRLDPERFNRILWEGIMGSQPYPTTRSGRNLARKGAH